MFDVPIALPMLHANETGSNCFSRTSRSQFVLFALCLCICFYCFLPRHLCQVKWVEQLLFSNTRSSDPMLMREILLPFRLLCDNVFVSFGSVLLCLID